MRSANGYTPRDVERWLHVWCAQHMSGEWRGRRTVWGQDVYSWDDLWDSDLTMDLEDSFGATLPDDRTLRTAGDVCDALIEAIPCRPYDCDGCHMRTFLRVRRILVAAGLPRRMIRRDTPLPYLQSIDSPLLRTFFRHVSLRGRFATIGGLVHALAADNCLPSGPGTPRLR